MAYGTSISWQFVAAKRPRFQRPCAVAAAGHRASWHREHQARPDKLTINCWCGRNASVCIRFVGMVVEDGEAVGSTAPDDAVRWRAPCRVIATRVTRRPGLTLLHCRVVAQSPAVRAVSASISLTTDLTRPFEGVGLERVYALEATFTADFAPSQHALHPGGVYDVVPAAASVCSSGPPLEATDGSPTALAPCPAAAVALARCSGDGKHVFKILHLLAPDSHYSPPPLAAGATPHGIFGLAGEADFAVAHRLWLTEGEASGEPSGSAAAAPVQRVQRAGERVSDVLRRKPTLKKWVTATAVRLQQQARDRSAAARHPLVKQSHLVTVAAGLTMCGVRRFFPITPSAADPEAAAEIPVSLPDGLGEKTGHRRRQWASRKRPQLIWMLERIDELLPPLEHRVVLDIGGGRGDLAVLLGQRRKHWHTVAIDIHPPSVKGGREAIAAAGVADRARVLQIDARDLLAGGDVRARAVEAVGRFDAVVGLHCCGGLSETAVSWAAEDTIVLKGVARKSVRAA